WLRASSAKQRLQDADEAPAEHRVICVTQDRMNAWLSLSDQQGNELERVRVRMLQDRIRVAAELPALGGVISCDFRLTGDQDQLRLELLGARIGRLPVPIATLLRWLPDDAIPSDGKTQVSLDSDPPLLLWDLIDAPDVRPIVHKIESVDGAVEITIGAPALSR
ncbi:MAG: hypothetical protein AAFU85_31125, partial [Planctomycetota bacterium]